MQWYLSFRAGVLSPTFLAMGLPVLPVLHVILALIRVTYQFANNVKNIYN
jgi:hypothetical protein